MVDKKDKQKDSRQSFGFVAIADIVPNIVRPIVGKNHSFSSKVKAAWLDIMGSEIAARSRVVKINSSTEKGEKKNILQLEAEEGFAMDLSYQEFQIIEKVNFYFGKKIIDAVRIKQVSFKKPKSHSPQKINIPDNMLNNIDAISDEGLKSRLRSLLESIKK